MGSLDVFIPIKAAPVLSFLKTLRAMAKGGNCF